MSVLPVGGVWDGSQLTTTAYPLPSRIAATPTSIQQVNDPDDGQPCLEFNCLNTDFASQISTHPNPRAQLSSAPIFQPGGEYRWLMQLKIHAGAVSMIKAGWICFTELYGRPFAGSPPVSWGYHGTGQQGLYHGAGNNAEGTDGQALALVPFIEGTVYQQIEFVFQLKTSGLLQLSYASAPGQPLQQIYTCSTFAVDSVADSTGPQTINPQIYMERGCYNSVRCYQRHTITRIA